MDQRPVGFVPFRSITLSAEPSRGASPKPLLICFSHLRWDFVWQRPQHLLSRAARAFDVVVMEEPEYRPDVTPHLETSTRAGNIRIIVPVVPYGTTELEAIVAQRQLLERFIAAEPARTRVFWYYTPMAMAFSGHIPADLTIYDNMDELSLFRGASPELIANEEELFARADLVFTGGMSLYEAKRDRHHSVHAFPSSIEFDHFAAGRNLSGPEPADLAAIPHPRLGFFGVIDERMDIDLVGTVADLRPDWHFVMIGPVVKVDPATLPQRPNIHWLGPKKYPELPTYLGRWDVGFMPFALNESTRFISPTKTPEFLAAGLPVVSTAIRDVVRPYGEKGLVEIAASPEEVVSKCGLVMARSRQPWLSRVDRHLAAGSWDRTWQAMQQLIDRGLGEPLEASEGARSTSAPQVVRLTPAE